MKGYWIILGTAVTDTEAQQEYARLWAPIAQQYDARLVMVDDRAVLERHFSSRAMMVEFASYEQAWACYHDPAYAHAKAFALRAAHREVLIIQADIAEVPTNPLE